ncbi:hypothetical protein T459_24986 [Capsicum annuum]|uniref:Uncharacterized protein n=1 Tax=Capsicum annuum TaxID=4072 RepID=A0A2G2YJF6_CAPAN|nr:hypothetical protein T459_24986 [Capsicum annuum]
MDSILGGQSYTVRPIARGKWQLCSTSLLEVYPQNTGIFHHFKPFSNKLTGAIPSSLGKLTSLLWLMLANNSLTSGTPHELENCSSLLWLNLANNQLSGPISPQLARIGSGSEECFAMKRWLPADYPPLSFVYQL